MIRPLLLLTLICFILSSCQRCNFYNIPADVGQGGRAVGVAIHPANENIIWVATETGGVFHTTSGGRIWYHADSLPQFTCFDIQISRTDPNVVIVSTTDDTQVSSGGGIWITRDAGRSWRRPTSSLIRRSSGFARNSAYGISFMAGTSRVYIGTDSGLAVSNDLGMNWEYVNPYGAEGRKAIWSVLTLQSGKVIVYGQQGIRMSNDGRTGWVQDMNRLPAGWAIADALAVSPRNQQHLFFTNGWESLYYSTNGGVDWNSISIDFRWYDGRQPYVKVVNSASGRSDELDLYYSNMSLVRKKTIRWTGSNYDFTSAWTPVNFLHPDPADLAFSNDGINPLIAANDGGVEKTRDRGASWQVISKPSNFFNALQIFNVKGTFYTGTPNRVDLYFGTQDNYFWGSSNDGLSWPYATGNEGYQIQGPLSYNSSSDSSISYFNIGGCPWCRSDPHYRNPTDITQPSAYPTSIPVFAGGKTYFAFAKSGEFEPRTGLYISDDEGRTWRPMFFLLPYMNVGFPVVSGSGDSRVIITAVYLSGSISTGDPVYGLLKIANAFNRADGDERQELIPFPSRCNLGTVATMWPWYPCFAVDPANPDFIIIPNISREQILITSNGGRNWTGRTGLLQLVTGNGKYLFHKEFASPQIRSIAIDPRNRDHIMVGTAQAGIMYSRNRGRNWLKVPNSEQIPFVTSFFFRDDTTAIVSSYGRGLWKVFFNASTTSMAIVGGEGAERSSAPISAPDELNEGEIFAGEQFKPQSDSYDSTRPTLYIKSEVPGSAIINIKAGTRAKMTGTGWFSNLVGENPLVITINDEILSQQIKIDSAGKFIFELPKLSEPKLYKVQVIQFDRQQTKKEASLLIKVSIADEMKLNEIKN